MQTHELKTWPDPFAAIWRGDKTHEFRKDDRDPRFSIGDILELVYHDPERLPVRGRVPARITAKITHISRPPYCSVPPEFCVMSIAVLRRAGNAPS